MIDSIFKREYTRNLHKNAPFLKEREAYLRHLQMSGRRKAYLQKTATIMLHIIRVLELKELRVIDGAEIENAATQWASEDSWQRNLRGRRTAADRFAKDARKWLRFQKILAATEVSQFWFDSQLAEFRNALELRGLKPVTCLCRLCQIRLFFSWLEVKRKSIDAITLSDIDDYVGERLKKNYSPRSLDSDYRTLRLFFGYAEERGWCAYGFSRGISSPFQKKVTPESKGPTWREARRLIRSCDHDTPPDLRARAMLLLCSVYGFRNGEVTRLRLNDLDWEKEAITITRSKSGRVQQFPIQFEVGEAIIAYLRRSRPKTSCRHLFVTTYPPYRPLKTLWPVISRRMRKLAIDSQHFGPHALRHACATELLRKGASLREIADFLGHKGLSSVGIYAKSDVRSLREVAKISLAGLR